MKRKFSAKTQQSRSEFSIFESQSVHAGPVTTICAGRVAFNSGKVCFMEFSLVFFFFFLLNLKIAMNTIFKARYGTWQFHCTNTTFALHVQRNSAKG